MSELNLYQKIQAVSNDIKNIEKNMTVGKGSYSYKAVQDIDVTLEVKDAETKHGLVSIPIKQELVRSDIVKVMKDGGGESISYVDIVKMTLRIINLGKPEEFIDVESFGRGLDPGDKGFGKAATYARKYALLNAYKIATGEDPDDGKSKEQTAVKTPDEKRIAVTNFLMSNSNTCSAMLQRFNKGTVDELSANEIDDIFKGMKTRGMV
ncbi:ERF family protein [Bacteroides neonati]|uniref:ERF family protein n=1 Tax=Bacteroides neonati TaxID=1347393 RepID=UPI0004B1C667|nr:ERF family protein [Bacteroides neonati]